MSSSYYHKSISRIKAEEFLTTNQKNGSYLVRDSESSKGAFTLMLLKDGDVKQYRILPDSSNMLHVQAEDGIQPKTFHTLDLLIDYLWQSGEQNGLVCPLLYPVNAEDVEEEPDSDDDDYEDDPERVTSIEGHLDGWQRPPFPAADASYGLVDFSGTMNIGHQTSTVKQELPGTPQSKYQGVTNVQGYFDSRMKQLDLSNETGAFQQCIRKYVDEHAVLDAQYVSDNKTNQSEVTGSDRKQTISNRVPHLDNLINVAVVDVLRSIDTFMARIDLMRELFGPLQTARLSTRHPPLACQYASSDNFRGLETARENLKSLSESVANLHGKANSQFRQLMKTVPEAKPDVPSIPPSRRESNLEPAPKQNIKKDYKVAYLRTGRSNLEMSLTVDVTHGKLFLAKPVNTALNETNTFSHDQILMLVKHSKHSQQLEIMLKGHKPKSYWFDTPREREYFCQLVSQLKRQHSKHGEQLDNLSLFVGTFNCGDSNMSTPSAELSDWLACIGEGNSRDDNLRYTPHDMYVIGLQERKDWKRQEDVQSCILRCLKEHLRIEEEYVPIASCKLWAIGILVFVRKALKEHITNIETDTRKTGIGNQLGNKGAVAVAMEVKNTSLCFVCAHLAARQDASRNERRNQNFRDIISDLKLGRKSLRDVVDVTNRFHHVFFLGDLNYRIDDQETPKILKMIENKEWVTLLLQDQLTITKNDNKAYVDFKEDLIAFPPTYRMKREVRKEYVVEKQKKSGLRINTPSWCDRVLWKSYPTLYLSINAYGCVLDVKISDHKPVFASFQLGIPQPMLEHSVNENRNKVYIEFQVVRAKLKTRNKDPLNVEVHSTCLSEPVISKRSKEYDAPYQEEGYFQPKWDHHSFGKMEPTIKDASYLEEQHLILVVKSDEQMEIYGAGVIALRDLCNGTPKSLTSNLTHRGELVGAIEVSLRVNGLAAGKPKGRNYEFIYMDTQICSEQQQQPLAFNSRPIDDIQRMALTKPRISALDSQPVVDDAMKPSAHGGAKGTTLRDGVKHAVKSSGDGYENVTLDNTTALAPTGSLLSTKPPSALPVESGLVTKPKRQPIQPPKPCGHAPPHSGGVPPPYFNRNVGRRNEGGDQNDDRQARTAVSQMTATNQNPATKDPLNSELFEDNPVYEDEAVVPDDCLYEVIEAPKTVAAFLQGLALERYTEAFIENGFDQMHLLVKMDEEDVNNVGVNDISHRVRIKNGIRLLRRTLPM